MAPQIDFMVTSGLMGREEGARHPDRNTLTSVLSGDRIPRIDCPADPFRLQDSDIIIAASDGLQFLTDGSYDPDTGLYSTRTSTMYRYRL